MATFESAITRAETDLAQVQSVLGAAQQVLEVADRAHSAGRRLVKAIRVVAIVFAIGGVLVAAVLLFDRLSQRSRRNQAGETADANPPTRLTGPPDKQASSDMTPVDQTPDS